MIKKIASFATAGAMFLGMSLPAFAADCTVTTSGPFSTNTCKVKKLKTVNTSLSNNANIFKTQGTSADSGYNTNNFNTTTLPGGGISTNPASSSNNNLLDVNSSLPTIDQTAGDPDPSTGLISTSGPFSTNTVRVKSNKIANVSVSNNATVTTVQSSSANSGHNDMSYNTVVSGNIQTGTATSSNTDNTTVNWTQVLITQ